MNIKEMDKSLRALRLSGMANALETRILQAQTDSVAPIDFLATLVDDEVQTRADRLLARRIKFARFRDQQRTLDEFDFGFAKKVDKKLLFELATCRFIDKNQDVLFLGPPGTGKSHLAQAIGMAAILQNHRVAYREAHVLLEQIAEARIEQTVKDLHAAMMKIPLLIIDDLAMRKLPTNAAEELLELIMRRHQRASTIITSNRPIDDWGKLLGDTAAVTALLDRLLHHGHVIKCGPNSYRTRSANLNCSQVLS